MKNPYEKKCPQCKETMAGPFWEGDDRGDYFVWTCPACAYRCEKFKFEIKPDPVAQDPNIRSLTDYYNDPSYRR